MDEDQTAWAEALARESAPETEQVQTVEPPEADTSDQPTDVSEDAPAEQVEEPKSRSQERIHQLTGKVNDLQEQVDYWKSINKQPEVLPIEENEDGVTVDQISASVINKLAERDAERERTSAAKAMQADVAQTIQVYPELDSDDDLAAIVVSMAEKRGISIRSAADKVMGLISKEKETAEKRVMASQAQRVGVSSPQGVSVGNGAPSKMDVSSMSEQDKESNWDAYLAAHSN